MLLVIVPGKADIEGYREFAPSASVQFTQLPRLEEQATALVTRIRRLATSTIGHFQTASSARVDIEGAIRECNWCRIIPEWRDLFQVLGNLKSEADALETDLLVLQTKPQKAETDMLVIDVAEDMQLQFLECLYVIVGTSQKKEFLGYMNRYIDMQSLVLCKTQRTYAVYKIYCIPAMVAELMVVVRRRYTCLRRGDEPAKTNGGPRMPGVLFLAGQAAENEGNVKSHDALGELSGKIAQMAILFTKASFFAAYVESLHRYGMMDNYKYILVDPRKMNPRSFLKSVKRKLVSTRLIELTPDDEEFPFTYMDMCLARDD